MTASKSDVTKATKKPRLYEHGVSLENFELVKVLGQGAYGKVFLVRKIGGADGGAHYAMKILRKERVVQKAKTLEHIMSERSALEAIRECPFVVNLRYAFQSESKLHLVMDYVSGGELFTHLCSRTHFTLDETRLYAAEMVIALDALHRHGIIYRDIKLENVMLDSEGHIVITDLGLSKHFRDSQSHHQQAHRTDSYCGTIEYMAPEIIQKSEKGYDECVDWWSLGVLLFELLTGCSPFTVEGSANSSREIAKRIMSKAVPWPKTFPSVAKDVISRLLEKVPSKRLGSKGVEEIQKHLFFAGIDWEACARREIEPPFKPHVSSNIDTSNFAAEFTDQQPQNSPVPPPDAEHRKLFRGYSYVSPAVLLNVNNEVGYDFISENAQQIQTFGEAQMSPFFLKYELDMSETGFLGSGSFSICRKCRVKKSPEMEFCVKIVSQRFAASAQREATILNGVRGHRHIVGLEEVMEDEFYVYLVLDLMRGPELLGRIRSASHFSEREAARIMRQLVSAVAFLHTHSIVHRDLKPENVLFESAEPNASLRLIDFGFARCIPSPSSSSHTTLSLTMSTPCYTLQYAAPELLSRSAEPEDVLPRYNQQCDLWSLGVMLYTMLSGSVPFFRHDSNETATSVMSRIKTAEYSFTDEPWGNISQGAKELVAGLLTVDPEKRLSIMQVQDHSWLAFDNTPDTPLCTPTALTALGRKKSLRTFFQTTTDDAFKHTMQAMYNAAQSGFHLQDVASAPLALRRQAHRTEGSSTTDDSGFCQSPEKPKEQTSPAQPSPDSSQSEMEATPRASARPSVDSNSVGTSDYLTPTSTDPGSSGQNRKRLFVLEGLQKATPNPDIGVKMSPAFCEFRSDHEAKRFKSQESPPHPTTQAHPTPVIRRVGTVSEDPDSEDQLNDEML